MAYIDRPRVHDADAHIMEPPNWLRDHADPDIRDRLDIPLPIFKDGTHSIVGSRGGAEKIKFSRFTHHQIKFTFAQLGFRSFFHTEGRYA